MNHRALFSRPASLFVLCMLALLLLRGAGGAEEKSYALLVVSNGQSKAMKALEKDIYRSLGLLRERVDIDKVDLPIISYHVDQAGEKAYCEKTLGIKPAHLVFVGLVEQDALVARKVVFRVNNVTNGYEACVKVMTQAARVLGKNPAALANPSPSPSAAPSAVPGMPLGVSLNRVDIVNAQGQVQQVYATTDAGVYVNVFLHNDQPESERRHTLGVKITGPDGKQFGRTLGGPLTVAVGEKLDAVEMVKRADPDRHNGYLIGGRTIGKNPGTYGVAVEIDGREVGRTEFTVSADPATKPSTASNLDVVDSYLADDQGRRRFTYRTTDAGVYVYVVLRNRTPDKRHRHKILVSCLDGKGDEFGRPLGGAFVVSPGDDLGKKDFPRDADEERHNGFLIKGHRMGNNPGPYRVVIELDQQKVKIMHFRITD